MGSFTWKNVQFFSNDQTLTSMVNLGTDPVDVVISNELPSEKPIIAIGPRFSMGQFNKITIEDSVEKISPQAFHGAEVKEVVWPSFCPVIPLNCFERSTLEVISNIANVKSIENRAFCNSRLKEMAWPAKCRHIPLGCFNGTPLGSISGIEQVTKIEPYAFCFCGINEFVWPSGCQVIPYGCFSFSRLQKITNLDNVISIISCSFNECVDLEFVDLSGAICDIGDEAFSGVRPESVLLPYYSHDTDRLFNHMFGWIGLLTLA